MALRIITLMKKKNEINKFFAFSSAINTYIVFNSLRFQNTIANCINRTYTYRGRYNIGASDFATIADITCVASLRNNTTNFKISLSAISLTNEEMKKFIQLLNKETFTTFKLCFYSKKQ